MKVENWKKLYEDYIGNFKKRFLITSFVILNCKKQLEDPEGHLYKYNN